MNHRTPYRGPERRVQFDDIEIDSPLICRVLAGLFCFWLVVGIGVPALWNAWARSAS